MVSKAKRKTGTNKKPRTTAKKAARKAAKQATRKTTKKPAKPSAKKTTRKPAKAKGANTTARSTKKCTRKTAGKAARKNARKAAKKTAVPEPREPLEPNDDEVTLTLDEIADVDDLVDDTSDTSKSDESAPKVARRRQPAAHAVNPTASKNKKSGPRTPTVPRTVKPTPKIADLEMDGDVLEFVEAIDAYRQEFCRPFPTWTEVFYLLRELGYAKA